MPTSKRRLFCIFRALGNRRTRVLAVDYLEFQMKRDMDLLRQMLLLLEATSATEEYGGRRLSVDGYDEYTIAEHGRLLLDAGLIEGEVIATFGGPPRLWIRRLTWGGHEFLDAARNDTVWAKVRSWVVEKGGDVPFAIVKEMTLRFAAAYFDSELQIPGAG